MNNRVERPADKIHSMFFGGEGRERLWIVDKRKNREQRAGRDGR